MLEVDINGNPLRSNLIGGMLTKASGFAALDDSPGPGVDPDLSRLASFRVDPRNILLGLAGSLAVAFHSTARISPAVGVGSAASTETRAWLVVAHNNP